ncbi:beta-glucosidase [Lasiosphaeria miniovina]|uniref:beta-glucosidase n=1 Tax=Lasiosphaeria miniovina TaxID=1954250 RepID=A0AA40E6L7_9PEZI|nr:beta-glucosidase [Lasiosphaeria miniovina]KAK0726967.1 beta-glucosidase [Lasiosphaeria miniovina]
MADLDVEKKLRELSVSDKCDLLAGQDFWHTKSLPKHDIPSIRMSDGPNGVRGTHFFNGVPSACFPCGTALGATWNVKLLCETGEHMGAEARLKSAHVILGPTVNMQRSPLGGRGFESISEDPVLAGLGAGALINGIQSTGVQATIKHCVCNDQEHRRNAMQAVVTQRALREIYLLPFQLAIRDSKPGALMTGYNGINGTYCSENTDLFNILRKEWDYEGLIMSDWFGTYSTTAAANAGLDLEMPGPPRFRGEVLKFNVGTDKVPRYVINERTRSFLKFLKKCYASGIPERGPETTGNTEKLRAFLRRLGNESLVLLKNENNVLPLKKDKKTVVIGPNAKVAVYHGGGSAVIPAYYAVTPFDGIADKLKPEIPDYTIGSHAHKMLPILGPQVINLNKSTGFVMSVYDEGPDVQNRKYIDKLTVQSTEMLFTDYTVPKQALWYADFDGLLVAEQTGDYEFGVVVVGTAKLFVDGQVVVDNASEQQQGDAFFGAGTIEVKKKIPVEKGKSYKIHVEFASAPTSKLPDNNALFGGSALRLGGVYDIDAEKEIQHAVDLAKGAEQVIICGGLNADWETEGIDREVMDLPAPMDDLICRVARANKNTVFVNQSGTPVTMPWIDEVSAVVQAWYGGNETGNVIADVLFGDVNPSAKLSLSFPIRVQDNPAYLNFRAEGGRTLYGEDIYVGYRFYDQAHRPVLFPFGHGLSYTTFEFSDLTVTERPREGTDLVIEVNVKNTGSVEGAEVVEVYILPPDMKSQPVATVDTVVVCRPKKELKGFTKVLLGPGDETRACVVVPTKYATSYWDEVRAKWCSDCGKYTVVASSSSAFTPENSIQKTFDLKGTFWWKGL